MNKEIQLSIIVKAKDLFSFLLFHTYTSLSGIIGVFISLGALYLLIVNYKTTESTGIAILVVASLLFTVIQPIQLFAKAKQQVLLNPTYKEPFNYAFGDSGIKVNQNETEAEVTWGDMVKAVSTRKYIFLYTSRVTAFIIPKSSLESSYEPFLSILQSKLDKSKMKIKTKS